MNTQFFSNKNSIELWLKKHSITEYTIHSDLVVDVNQSVFLVDFNLTHFPIQFGKVNGQFNCSKNHLTSLLGAPFEINGNFGCENNQLTSLKDGPKKINGSYLCAHNQLTSLEYLASGITDIINMSYNQITSLKGVHIDISFALLIAENPLKKLTYEDLKNIEADSFYASFEQISSHCIFPEIITAHAKPELHIVNFKEVKKFLQIEHEKKLLDKTISQQTPIQHKIKL